jgi:pilus assembly protein FimV
MNSRNALVARLGLSALLSSGLLLTPTLAWSADDGGADAADDAPADVAPSTGAAGTSGAAGTGGAAGVSGDGGVKLDGSVVTDGGSDGPRPDGGAGTSGAAGTAVVIPEDDAGCSTAGRSNDSPTGLFAFLGAGAAVLGLGYWRRRSRR